MIYKKIFFSFLFVFSVFFSVQGAKASGETFTVPYLKTAPADTSSFPSQNYPCYKAPNLRSADSGDTTSVNQVLWYMFDKGSLSNIYSHVFNENGEYVFFQGWGSIVYISGTASSSYVYNAGGNIGRFSDYLGENYYICFSGSSSGGADITNINYIDGTSYIPAHPSDSEFFMWDGVSSFPSFISLPEFPTCTANQDTKKIECDDWSTEIYYYDFAGNIIGVLNSDIVFSAGQDVYLEWAGAGFSGNNFVHFDSDPFPTCVANQDTKKIECDNYAEGIEYFIQGVSGYNLLTPDVVFSEGDEVYVSWLGLNDYDLENPLNFDFSLYSFGERTFESTLFNLYNNSLFKYESFDFRNSFVDFSQYDSFLSSVSDGCYMEQEIFLNDDLENLFVSLDFASFSDSSSLLKNGNLYSFDKSLNWYFLPNDIPEVFSGNYDFSCSGFHEGSLDCQELVSSVPVTSDLVSGTFLFVDPSCSDSDFFSSFYTFDFRFSSVEYPSLYSPYISSTPPDVIDNTEVILDFNCDSTFCAFSETASTFFLEKIRFFYDYLYNLFFDLLDPRESFLPSNGDEVCYSSTPLNSLNVPSIGYDIPYIPSLTSCTIVSYRSSATVLDSLLILSLSSVLFFSIFSFFRRMK